MVKDSINNRNWSEMGSTQASHFEPHPYYDEESDAFTLYIAEDESKRERIDRFLTLYRSIETGELVGCHLKDVKKVLSTFQAYNIGIKTESITLGLLLLAVPWTELQEQEEPIRMHVMEYSEIAKVAGDVKIDLPEFAGC